MNGCMACMYECILGAQGGQKMASDSLELELERIMSYHAGAGNQTLVF